MASVDVHGITVEYELRGRPGGPPLLLVMGLGGQLVSWPPAFVDQLCAAGFRVILFDNRDSGRSSKGVAPAPSPARVALGFLRPAALHPEYLLTDMAADAVGLLDHLGVRAAHAVGISMGGMIAQTLAIEHPSRVRSLTSIMSTTGSRRVGRTDVSLLARLPRLSRGSRDTALERELELFRRISGTTFDEDEVRTLGAAGIERCYCPEGTLRQTAAILASGDRTEALHSVTAPTLVVHGLDDPLVQPSGGRATAAAVPGSRLLMFPGMGHNLPAERHDEIVAAIVANAARADAPTAPVEHATPSAPTGVAVVDVVDHVEVVASLAG